MSPEHDPKIDPDAPDLEAEPTVADKDPRTADLPENDTERMGQLQFLPAEIAIVLGDSTLEDKIQDPDSEEFHYYQRGRLVAEAEVRQAILASAKQGSTPAQKQFFDIAKATRREAPVQNQDANAAGEWE